VHVTRRLPADEVLARFIDALAAAHGRSAQRQPVTGAAQPVDAPALRALAAQLETLMAERGFTGLRVDLADGQGSPEHGLHGFYRTGDEGLVQTVLLHAGRGVVYERDGAGGDLDLEGTVTVMLRVLDTSILDATGSILSSGGGREYVLGTEVGQWTRHAVSPRAAALAPLLLDECLPWFDTVRSRTAIVTRWVRDPGSQPPWYLPEKIEVAARWNMRGEASELLRHGRREQPQYEPQFVAVEEKFQL
jgi:hypothetical protein